MFTSRHEETLGEIHQLQYSNIRHHSDPRTDLESQLPSSRSGPSSEVGQDIELDDLDGLSDDDTQSTPLRSSTESDTSILFEALNAYNERWNSQQEEKPQTSNPKKSLAAINMDRRRKRKRSHLSNSKSWKRFQKWLYPFECWINDYWVWLFALLSFVFFAWVVLSFGGSRAYSTSESSSTSIDSVDVSSIASSDVSAALPTS